MNASRHIECNENTFDLDGDAANGCEVDCMGWMNSGQIRSRPKTRPKPQKVAVLEGESPAISGKSRLVKYHSICPDEWDGMGMGYTNFMKLKNQLRPARKLRVVFQP